MGNNPFLDLQEHIDHRYNSIQKEIKDLKEVVEELTSQKHHTVTELAEKANSHPQTIRKLILSGDIKAERFGRKYIIPHKEFQNACNTIKTLKYKR